MTAVFAPLVGDSRLSGFLGSLPLGQIRVDPVGLSADVQGARIDATGPSDLRSRLATELYAQLHVRRSAATLEPGHLHQDLTESLGELVPTRQVWRDLDPVAPRPVDVGGRELLVVQLDGLRIVSAPGDVRVDDAGRGRSLRVSSLRPATTPGFFMALGARPLTGACGTARLYMGSDDPAETLRLWPALLEALDTAGVPYQAKALSSSTAHPRSDALVAYAPETALRRVAVTLSAFRVDTATDRRSLFVEPVGPGTGLAHEPVDDRESYRGLSFGQHRARVLAEALLEAPSSVTELAAAWDVHARAAQIDPAAPWRNLVGP